MRKVIFVCDKCGFETSLDCSLYSLKIIHKTARISDSFDLCHQCFKDVIKLIKNDGYVFTSDELADNKEVFL